MKEADILPYYENTQIWEKKLNDWIKEKETKENIAQEEFEEYFYSAFSCGNYKAYGKGVQLLIKKKNTDCNFYTLAQKTLEYYTKGNFTKAKKAAKEAVEHLSQNKTERLYFFQLYKETRLKKDLERIKSIKHKLKYLELKYFEISGNVLYSTDILGVKLFLKYKSKQTNSPYFLSVKKTIEEIYSNTKNFKGDLNSLEIYNNRESLPSLANLSCLALQKKEIEKIGFSGIQLIILSKLLASGMYMQASLTLRELSKEYYIKNKDFFHKRHNVHYLYSTRACLEENHPICLSGFTQPERYQTALEYSNLYTKPKKQLHSSLKLQFEKNDEKYSEYIYGKEIAIVGPVNTGLNNGSEIDSHDIVIRLNIINPEKYPKKVFGTKTSSAYFVRDQFIKEKDSLIQNLDSIDFISFHTVRDDDLFKLIENNKKLRTTIKYHERINNIFFSGYPNLIQRTILDLLRFNPKSIKVFNANLWIENIQSDYYIYKQIFYPANLILHDVYSNFILTQNLYKNKYISADEVLSEVLNTPYTTFKNKIISSYEPQLRKT